MTGTCADLRTAAPCLQVLTSRGYRIRILPGRVTEAMGTLHCASHWGWHEMQVACARGAPNLCRGSCRWLPVAGIQHAVAPCQVAIPWLPPTCSARGGLGRQLVVKQMGHATRTHHHSGWSACGAAALPAAGRVACRLSTEVRQGICLRHAALLLPLLLLTSFSAAAAPQTAGAVGSVTIEGANVFNCS